MFIAKNGELYIDNKRIGQLIIPTNEKFQGKIDYPKQINSFIDLMNKNIITKEKFNELIKNNDIETLLHTPLYSNLYKNMEFFNLNIKGSPIDFDFIQIQGVGLIYADGNEVKYIPPNIDMEKVNYYLRTRGLKIENTYYIDDENVLITMEEKLQRVILHYNIDTTNLKKYSADDKIIYSDRPINNEIFKKIEFGVIKDGKIYGIIPTNDLVLTYNPNSDKLYLDNFEVVAKFSLCGNKIMTIDDVYSVKINHPYKRYKILSISNDYATIEYCNDNGCILRKEHVKTVKYYKKLILKKRKESSDIVKILENTYNNFHNTGTIYFKFTEDEFILTGYGVIKMNFIVDHKKEYIYIPSKNKVYKLKIIETPIELNNYIP